jgi:hypothetical protein
VKLVYEHHNKTQALKPVFVDEAVFVREEGKSYWRIGVRYEKYETGLLVYTVSSDGTVESHSVVKDG